MKTVFYKIWNDAIYWEKLRPHKREGEILAPFAAIVIAQFANTLSLLLLLQLTGVATLYIDSGKTGSVVPKPLLTLFLLLPFVMLNYFAVFHKRDYMAHSKMAMNFGGKLYIGYVLGSGALLLLLLFTA
jgi:hypothetical protein